eukprot:TRINITY_DN3465_c0_g1_i1.p1 TRINITY_DN3465_c0_g1~~TRINITY_DN3465_c0_g1_i1.p1  ORF type:complete len:366 (+),score=81.58 TRINITY_DN3465_c0_g1_i1:230-1327(+)
MIPTLEIIKQTSLTEEKVTKRGKTSTVFVVVKNSPFQLSVALRNSQTNFNHLAYDISLIYDMPGFNKEVSYVSTKPVDTKSSVSDLGDEICFDVKIKVLSSHHEDNFFRLQLTIWDPNNESFPQLCVLSHPIKVISKPMNQRKTRKRTTPSKRKADQDSEHESPIIAPVVQTQQLDNYVPQLYSNNNDSDFLNRLDAQQQETLKMLRILVDKQMETTEQMEPPFKRQKTKESSDTFISSPSTVEEKPEIFKELDFESAFSMMLRAYSAMSAEQKAERTRKLTRSLSLRDQEQLEEFVDIMGTVGLRTENLNHYPVNPINMNPMQINAMHVNNNAMTCGHNENCAESCPHRMELVRMDQFYNEVFF